MRYAPRLGSIFVTSDKELTWAHSFTENELSFLRGHRVGKVPLLPGTCYIEFVRTVVLAVHGQQLYSLEDVNFQTIMFLDDDPHLYGSPLVQISLDKTSGLLTICSRRDKEAWTTHAQMRLQLDLTSALRTYSEQHLDVPGVQAQCSETVTGEAFYSGTGNDYRGEFRALAQGWAGGVTCLSLVEYAHNETEQVHLRACAFLDACAHAGLWWQDHRRRPFFAASVGAYRVTSIDQHSNRTLWSIVSGESENTETGGYRIFDSAGKCLVHTTGGSSGFFEIGQLEQRRNRRHTYVVEWERAKSAGSTQQQLPAVFLCPMESSARRNDELLSTARSLDDCTLILVAPQLVDSMAVLAAVLTLLQCTGGRAPSGGVMIVTQHCQATRSVDVVKPDHVGTWGLCRSARSEGAQIEIKCVDVHARGGLVIAGGLAVMRAGSISSEIALRGGTARLPRLVTPRNVATHEEGVEKSGVEWSSHLVTGGSGGLGQLTARWLADTQPGAWLVLLSRSGALSSDGIMRLRAALVAGAGVVTQRCDVAEPMDVQTVSAIAMQQLPPVRGIWHTAGVLADGLIVGQDVAMLQRPHCPKSGGAQLLQRAHASAPLQAHLLFSSIAGLIGGAGQSNYASANVSLDALAACRRAQGLNGSSVNWGPWAEVGMASGAAVNSRMGAMGLGLIDPWQGLAALEAAAMPNSPAVTAFWPVRWEVMLGRGSAAPALLERFAPRAAPSRGRSAPQLAKRRGSTEEALQSSLEMVRRTAGASVDLDTPLLEAGLDSLGAVELRNVLGQAIGVEELPSTLFDDYPTARMLAGLLVPTDDGDADDNHGAAREGVSNRIGLDEVLEMVSRTAGSEVDADTPLADTGLDSLATVELRNQIQQAVGDGMELPGTILDDHPTARLLVEWLQPAMGTVRGGSMALAPSSRSVPLAVQQPVALNLSTLSARLGGVFEASETTDLGCMALLRPPKAPGASSGAPPLVIMHSFLGDESGYERLWKLALPDRAIYAVRHRFLARSDADAEATPMSAADMLTEYAEAIIATLGAAPFDLIGASYGSLVAQQLAHQVRAAGASPRKLVLIDPFPFWPRIRETAPNSELLAPGEGQDARAAAQFILKLRLQSQHGAEKGDAILEGLLDELNAIPGDAVGLFLAAQSLPADASREELLVQALREQRRVKAVSSVGPTIIDLVEGLQPFRAASGEPAVLMVLASGRRAFFERVYGTADFEDATDLYAPAMEPMRLDGAHFDVVTRCISNRVPEFTQAVVDFLREPEPEAEGVSRNLTSSSSASSDWLEVATPLPDSTGGASSESGGGARPEE